MGFPMTEINFSDVHSLDRLTLGKSKKTDLLKKMKLAGTPYVKYDKRVGLGLVNLSIEVKRLVDRHITELLKKHLPVATDGRFNNLYCDVRVYPQLEEPDSWLEEIDSDWQRLYVLVNFVISIPKTDSLDSMARASLLSFFQEESWVIDKKLNAARKRLKLWEKLNIDVVSELIGGAYFDEFPRDQFSGVNLEIDCDGVFENDFDHCSVHSRLVDYATRFDASLTEKAYAFEKLTSKNARKYVPFMVGGIANALGVKQLSPKKLKRTDNLYALMRFDDKLTHSLVQSIKVSVDVMEVLGGPTMFTLGDAIDFACETLEYREEDETLSETFDALDQINYEDGAIYKGDIENDEPNGKGQMTWVDGSTYDGEWLEGMHHGQGKYTWVDGASYEGRWVNGVKEGLGKFTWTNGVIYEGQWSGGTMSGSGEMRYANGQVQKGEFLAGEFVKPKGQ
jgi:hypothetical protein